MRCGYCHKSLGSVKGLYQHWKLKKCPQWQFVWEKVMIARKRGHSGRRILSKAFPHLYPSKPMSEETKEKLRSIKKTRRTYRANTVRGRHRHGRQDR